MSMRYVYRKDDDGHDFFVPEPLEPLFDAWLECFNYDFSQENPYAKEEAWTGPDFNQFSVGRHPSCYSFENVRRRDTGELLYPENTSIPGELKPEAG